jgi:hypothetical protein
VERFEVDLYLCLCQLHLFWGNSDWWVGQKGRKDCVRIVVRVAQELAEVEGVEAGEDDGIEEQEWVEVLCLLK